MERWGERGGDKWGGGREGVTAGGGGGGNSIYYTDRDVPQNGYVFHTLWYLDG